MALLCTEYSFNGIQCDNISVYQGYVNM